MIVDVTCRKARLDASSSRIKATTRVFLTRSFVLPVSRPLSRRRGEERSKWRERHGEKERTMPSRDRARENESVGYSEAARMTYGSRAERRPPLYLDSKVRAQRASCYDINCRLSSVTTYLCVHVVPSIAIADFATPLGLDPPSRAARRAPCASPALSAKYSRT